MVDKKDYALDNAITLDMSLDDIEDLPGFVTPPTGSYVVTVPEAPSVKEINEEPYLEIKLSIVEVVEITEELAADEKAPIAGDQFSYAFNLTNKVGAGNLKKFLAPIAERLDTTKLDEVAAGMKGMHLVIVNKRTYDEKKDRHYSNAKKVAVV